MILEDYEALKCRYPSKKCWNQRAVKRNGERHNLCEMHRQKANNNQRRLDKKRKAGHLLKSGGSPTAPPATVALELRAAPVGIPTPESETSEYDYRRHQHHHQQHQQHLQQYQHHEQQQHLQHQLQQQQHEHQQYLYHQHHHHQQHQQEKRLRASLSHMYAAAQSLSPQSPPRHSHAHHPYRRPVSVAHPMKRERELAPLRPSSSLLPPSAPSSSVAARAPMLHLPPLTAHISSLRSSPLRLPTPAASSSSRSASSSPSSPLPQPTDAKPTILLPPITSVPRCHPSGAFPLPRAGVAAPSSPLPSWLRPKEKINSA